MNFNKAFLNELKHEAAVTRKMLALVPMDKHDWKPHDKSMPMRSLAKHISELPNWVGATLNYPELDFEKPAPKIPPYTTSAELLANFDKHIAEATRVLEAAPEDEFLKDWSLRQGEKIFLTMPKAGVLRGFVFNHTVHHRAQLGVYLRLLNIPIPGSYGPSADDQNM